MDTKYHILRESGGSIRTAGHALGLGNNLDAWSHQRVLCPDVLLPPSLGEWFRAISVAIFACLFCTQAISRNSYLVVVCITLFTVGLASAAATVCPAPMCSIDTD